MGLLSFLGAMATPANQIAAGSQQGQLQGDELQQRQAMSAVQMLRQQQQMDLARQEADANMRMNLTKQGFRPSDQVSQQAGQLGAANQGAGQMAQSPDAAPLAPGDMSGIMGQVAKAAQSGGDTPSEGLSARAQTMKQATGGPTASWAGQQFTLDPTQTPEAIWSRERTAQQRAMEDRFTALQTLRDKQAQQGQDAANLGVYKTAQSDPALSKQPMFRGPYDPTKDYSAALSIYNNQVKNAPGPASVVGMKDIQSPDGTPTTYLVYSDGTTKQLGGSVGKGAAVGTGGSMQGSQAPLDDMIAQYDRIAGHAKDIAAGTFKFTNNNATRSALGFGQSYAQAEGKPAIGAQVGQSAMDMFGMAPSNSPDQQRYEQLMAASRAMGDDAAKVFKGRQGFPNIALEIAQATLRPADIGHPDIVEQKLSRLRNIIKLAGIVSPRQAAAVNPADAVRFGIPTAGRGAVPQGGAPHPQTGLTDAQVQEAMAGGAKTPDAVRAYWANKPGGND